MDKQFYRTLKYIRPICKIKPVYNNKENFDMFPELTKTARMDYSCNSFNQPLFENNVQNKTVCCYKLYVKIFSVHIWQTFSIKHPCQTQYF